MYTIYVENVKCKEETLKRRHPNAKIYDLTSRSLDREAQKLSPFYPHGGIPVPFSGKLTAACVEGIWQGLKVFEGQGVCFDSFANSTMKNIKRTVRTFGAPRGHSKGVYSNELLGYKEARKLIYLPSYLWVLENVKAVQPILAKFKEEMRHQDLVFLDFNTNIDWEKTDKPLSHAGLVKLWLEGRYPGKVYPPKAPSANSAAETGQLSLLTFLSEEKK